MFELVLNVTEAEGNIILGALAKLPYETTFTLIQKLQAQGTKQLEAAKKDAPHIPVQGIEKVEKKTK